jgi:hypothetical protein
MSCVCILTPLAIAAWPALSSAVTAAAVSLGYKVIENAREQERAINQNQASNHMELEIEQSDLVTGTLGREQRIVVQRGGVTVIFSRNARGKASICVEGQGHTEAALQAMGEELSRCVVQKYVYQRILDEMRKRQFMVVEEAVQEDRSIRLKVRHWEN